MKNLLKKAVLRKQLPLYDGFKHLSDVQLYEVPHQSLPSPE